MPQAGFDECSCCGNMYRSDGSEKVLYESQHLISGRAYQMVFPSGVILTARYEYGPPDHARFVDVDTGTPYTLNIPMLPEFGLLSDFAGKD